MPYAYLKRLRLVPLRDLNELDTGRFVDGLSVPEVLKARGLAEIANPVISLVSALVVDLVIAGVFALTHGPNDASPNILDAADIDASPAIRFIENLWRLACGNPDESVAVVIVVEEFLHLIRIDCTKFHSIISRLSRALIALY